MRVGIIGLGRMGEGMSLRMIRSGIETYGYRRNFAKTQDQATRGLLTGACETLEDLVRDSRKGQARAIILMVVPAESVEGTIQDLLPFLRAGDILVDHGNSNFKDSRRRALRLLDRGIDYLDCGTSGGVYGLERGYCLMVGGDTAAVEYARPVFDSLSPDTDSAPRTANATGELRPGEHGWLHCGAAGAGHFVKMVHNGVEYGIMQAYAEGFNILKAANMGASYVAEGDAEVAPMSDPENYQYDIDTTEVAELWRRGSVVGSWLLDLTAEVMLDDSELDKFDAGVSDSGEGRWTVNAAVDLGVPAPVLSTALFERFSSRGLGNFAYRVLNGMRYMFGGHHTR